jgi:hypothetical protein
LFFSFLPLLFCIFFAKTRNTLLINFRKNRFVLEKVAALFEKTYTLLENGQVFEKVINGGLRGLDGVKKKKATALFRTAETLGLARAGFQYPGNTYSYIEVPLADGFNRISWGDNQYPIDSSIQNYFKALMEMVKTE